MVQLALKFVQKKVNGKINMPIAAEMPNKSVKTQVNHFDNFEVKLPKKWKGAGISVLNCDD